MNNISFGTNFGQNLKKLVSSDIENLKKMQHTAGHLIEIAKDGNDTATIEAKNNKLILTDTRFSGERSIGRYKQGDKTYIIASKLTKAAVLNGLKGLALSNSKSAYQQECKKIERMEDSESEKLGEKLTKLFG